MGAKWGGEITHTRKKKKKINFSTKEVALKIYKRDLFSCIRECHVQLYTSLISKSSRKRSFFQGNKLMDLPQEAIGILSRAMALTKMK